jgi:hypothetical protein
MEQCKLDCYDKCTQCCRSFCQDHHVNHSCTGEWLDDQNSSKVSAPTNCYAGCQMEQCKLDCYDKCTQCCRSFCQDHHVNHSCTGEWLDDQNTNEYECEVDAEETKKASNTTAGKHFVHYVIYNNTN